MKRTKKPRMKRTKHPEGNYVVKIYGVKDIHYVGVDKYKRIQHVMSHLNAMQLKAELEKAYQGNNFYIQPV